MNWNNMNNATSWTSLRPPDTTLNPNLDSRLILTRKAPAGAGLELYYGASLTTETHLKQLQNLASEQELIAKYQSLLSGKTINTSEQRQVLHHHTRSFSVVIPERHSGSSTPPSTHSPELNTFYRLQWERIKKFTQDIHTGQITGSTNKNFNHVVQIGIGGSDLGPRALYLAIKNTCPAKMKADFVSNVDPDDAATLINHLDPETTLIILVSKSGTTQETLANRDLICEALKKSAPGKYNPNKHIVAVTSETSPLAHNPELLDSFYINDAIGGRFSSTSAVGALVISLACGTESFEEILKGAALADSQALLPSIKDNAALLHALIGIFNRNIIGLGSCAIIPYSQALSRFPAHLQQLEMESNGKSVNRFGESISYPTCPVIFGECGTNAQHSFFQLLHQGTDIIPLEFITLRESQAGEKINGKSSQRKLKANLAAQIVALLKGRKDNNKNRNFNGMRPSILIVGDRLTPRTLGALLAHYENKTMFQGFCWNINSFDQEGVQLGKILTRSILNKDPNLDETLNSLMKILDI